MIKNVSIITASSFVAMFFLGVGSAVIGAASKNIGLTPHQIGLLIAVQNLGFILSVIVSGSLADTFSKTILLSWTSFILSISFFFFYAKDALLFNFLVMLCIGIGIGGYEGVADTLLLEIHDQRESLFITVNHFFATSGGLLITVYLVFLQMDWRKSLLQSAAIVFVLTLVFAFSRTASNRLKSDSFRVRLGFLFRQRPVMTLFILASCATGIELATIGILTSFLMDLRDFDQVTSKIGLIIFISGIACGRLLLGFITGKDRLVDTIALLFGLTALCSGVLYFIRLGNGATYLMLFITGATISALFPLIITFAGIKYSAAKGMILGMVKLGVPAGGMLVPFFISVVTKYGPFELSLGLFPLIGMIGFWLLLINRKELQSSATH